MHDFVMALGGGLLMGVAAAALYVLNGRILGISGVLGGALKVRSPDASWRWAFVAGMLSAGIVALLVLPGAFENTIERSVGACMTAGALVGVGTQLGSGCTSGHGICGIGRLSKRSIVATLTFMTSGALTVTFIRVFMDGRV
ncbi:MAG: YeeE/YedE family protein [Deltaproteobacteria bacterium]|nr:MAG: YeeE/YedE family protein [Deltaproteobacteria bacterium]